MFSSVAPPREHAEDVFETSEHETGGSSSKERSGDEEYEDTAQKEKLSKVKNEKWQRFQQLKERRKEMCNQLQEPKKRKERSGTRKHRKQETDFEPEKQTKSEIFRANKSAWKELCQNIDVNAHLSDTTTTKEKPKSKLEEKLDEAIEKGDFGKAETLSDEIAQQNLGVKIMDAIEVREYKKRKECEKQYQKANKKKKLIWGFEQKERWESKGNM